MPVSGQNQVSVKVTRKGQLHLMTSTFNNLSAKILFYSKDTLKQAYKRINSFKNKQKQANHNNTECNLSRVARGAELQGFFTPPSCGSTLGCFGNSEAGRKFLSYEFCLSSYFACPGSCHLFTLPVQGINSMCLSFPFLLLLLMENIFIGVLTVDIRVCILDRKAPVFSAVD